MQEQFNKNMKPGRVSVLAFCILIGLSPISSAQDATSKKIVEIGTQDPQVMTWLDILTNRFGGRMTGSG